MKSAEVPNVIFYWTLGDTRGRICKNRSRNCARSLHEIPVGACDEKTEANCQTDHFFLAHLREGVRGCAGAWVQCSLLLTKAAD